MSQLGATQQAGLRLTGLGFIAKTPKICHQGTAQAQVPHTQHVPSEQSQLQDKHENNPAGLPSSL